MENMVIIGSGPAGHTAAIYAARANINPLMYEGFMAGGVAAGGQLTTTTDVENYPGFPDGVNGFELMTHMRNQSLRYGARIETKTVTSVDLSKRPFKVIVGEESVGAKTVIVATGATAKRMHLPGEKKLWQKGISACAICDGALPLFRDKHLCLVGGGDSACEEALFLTKFAKKVSMIVRRDVFRASKVMQERVHANEKIEILWNTLPVDVLGEEKVEAVKVKDKNSGVEKDLPAGGLFYAIGHAPNTPFLDGQLKMDETGYILTTPGTTRTNVKGVFACGDVQDKVYRQAVTAAGTGCMAALEAERLLAEENEI